MIRDPRSTLRTALALTFLVASMALPAKAQSAAEQSEPWAEEIAEFEAFAARHLEATGMPGLSVAVMKDDWVWSQGFGFADTENQSPASPASAYRLASVTKPMTAVAILELVEEGKLDLDADIRTYVQYFPEKEHPITTRQLLGHLGGISHYQDYDLEGHFKDHKTTEESIAVFADFDLVAEPGTRYNYSSYGYNLAGAAIEGASGMSYGDFLRERVWAPMGMESTRMDDPYELIPNRVRGYRFQNGRLENSEFVDISSRFAAGGTRSTVLDLIKFVQGLAAHTVLTPDSTALMFESLATADSRYTDYGLGWGVAPINGRPRVTHSGGQAETATRLTWFPADDFAIALATNLEGGDLQAVQEKLLRLFYDETWNVLAFVPDARERAIYYAMAGAFRHGVADRRMRGGSTGVTPEVERAFAAFREATSSRAWDADPEATRKILHSGRHPAGDRAWVTLGSHIAAAVTGGHDAFTALHHAGEPAFFQAWVEHYRNRHNRVPRRLRFSRELEELIARWAADWEAVWTPEMRALILSDAVAPETLGETLRRAFDGRTLVPDYTPELVGFAQTAFQRGQPARGWAMARLGLDLYPEAENTNGLWGVVMLISSQMDEARAHLAKAAELDPDGYAGVDSLIDIASFFRGSGQTAAARSLLEIAAELHPESERLEDILSRLRED